MTEVCVEVMAEIRAWEGWRLNMGMVEVRVWESGGLSYLKASAEVVVSRFKQM